MFRNDAVTTSIREESSWPRAFGLRGLVTDLRQLRQQMYDWTVDIGWTDDVEPLTLVNEANLTIVDDSRSGIGSKGRFADLYVSLIEQNELVYVQPRYGWAGISLAHLAKKHHKKLTLFMPASRRVSEHQLVTIERGASPRFVKIAAMPVLNRYAEQYALEVGAAFLPFGLTHPFVTAAAVRVICDTLRSFPVSTMWSVASTGVLSRALQIALIPDGWSVGMIAVARNLKEGEVGRAKFRSYDLPFARSARHLPTAFDSAVNYDAKGFDVLSLEESFGGNAWFWNVAGNARPERLKASDVDSDRVWGDLRDLKSS